MSRIYLNAIQKLHVVAGKPCHRPLPGSVSWLSRWSRIGSTRQHSSSSPNEATSEAPSQDETTPLQRPIFPWRHEVTPLPRLVEGTLDHATKGELLSTVSVQTGNVQINALASAFMFLDVPWYQLFFFASWKGELAESMSWAFTQGVAGLLADMTLQTGTYLACLLACITFSLLGLCF